MFEVDGRGQLVTYITIVPKLIFQAYEKYIITRIREIY